VPAAFLKHPRGIRDIEEWYISTVSRREYVKEVFAGQTEIAVKNLELIYQAVGDRVHAAAQNTLFCSPDTYRELYLPFSKKLNDWIHTHTKWKTMKHCCGGCEPLIEGFIEAGFDILNPVQTSAKGMDPHHLVDKYGGRIVFWGGGVDTQKTLPFGEPDQVRREVTERLKTFGEKNGFVFATVHNIQCNTPTGNVLAMFQALGRSV
ncbi:MAG: uroporphyrinogen decarboxylase family protein, partial [Planctomycetota bacterium]